MTKLITLVVLLAATHANAGGYRYSDAIADAVGSFMVRDRTARAPMLEVGGGITTEGVMGDVAVGYGWGKRNTGMILPGSSLKRVMFGTRANLGDVAVRATVGYYTDIIGMLSVDVGLEAHVTGTRELYPIIQSMVGWRWIGIRSTASTSTNASMMLVLHL